MVININKDDCVRCMCLVPGHYGKTKLKQITGIILSCGKHILWVAEEGFHCKIWSELEYAVYILLSKLLFISRYESSHAPCPFRLYVLIAYRTCASTPLSRSPLFGPIWNANILNFPGKTTSGKTYIHVYGLHLASGLSTRIDGQPRRQGFFSQSTLLSPYVPPPLWGR